MLFAGWGRWWKPRWSRSGQQTSEAELLQRLPTKVQTKVCMCWDHCHEAATLKWWAACQCCSCSVTTDNPIPAKPLGALCMFLAKQMAGKLVMLTKHVHFNMFVFGVLYVIGIGSIVLARHLKMFTKYESVYHKVILDYGPSRRMQICYVHVII